MQQKNERPGWPYKPMTIEELEEAITIPPLSFHILKGMIIINGVMVTPMTAIALGAMLLKAGNELLRAEPGP
jgi:hypothetical protein